VVTARWCKWLAANHDKSGIQAMVELYHQGISSQLQQDVSDVANVNRISLNIAMLQVAWETWWEFVRAEWLANEPDRAEQIAALVDDWQNRFTWLTRDMAASMARQISEEKVATVFINAVQEGIDAKRYWLMPRREHALSGGTNAGWWDEKGVYLLPAIYDEVAKQARNAGRELGFSKQTLYGHLFEEGVIQERGKDQMTVVIQVGPSDGLQSKRVLHLKPGVIDPPVGPTKVALTLGVDDGE
jgi:hypothetical protein